MKVGILGGGQLAQMLMLAGTTLGIQFVIYSPTHTALTQSHLDSIIAEWSDAKALKQFAERVNVVTYETENIPYATIEILKPYCHLSPCALSLKHTQDRLLEKNLFTTLEIPTNHFMPIDKNIDLTHAATQLGYPFMVKSRRSGYDGKHQWKISNETELQTLQNKKALTDCIAESFIHFDYEISLIAVTDHNQNTLFYDVCRNTHSNGMLRSTHNTPNHDLSSLAQTYVKKIIDYFNYIGVLAVEFFVKENQLYANEIAPRVHNSGHWTIEGSYTSQFENHCRAICQLPLGNTESKGVYAMYNIIGSWPDRKRLLQLSRLSMHDYQKQAQPHRKLGHVTLPIDEAEERELIRVLG